MEKEVEHIRLDLLPDAIRLAGSSSQIISSTERNGLQIAKILKSEVSELQKGESPYLSTDNYSEFQSDPKPELPKTMT
jgi:hypothetical protein